MRAEAYALWVRAVGRGDGPNLCGSQRVDQRKNVEPRAAATGRPRRSNRLDTISLHMLDSYKMTRQMSEPHLEVTELSTLARPSIPK